MATEWREDVNIPAQLFAGIIHQAIEDIEQPRKTCKQDDLEEIRNEAIGYIFSEDSDEAFEAVGIDATVARARLAERI
jgi:hypothetical protein